MIQNLFIAESCGDEPLGYFVAGKGTLAMERFEAAGDFNDWLVDFVVGRSLLVEELEAPADFEAFCEVKSLEDFVLPVEVLEAAADLHVFCDDDRLEGFSVRLLVKLVETAFLDEEAADVLSSVTVMTSVTLPLPVTLTLPLRHFSRLLR